MRKFLVTKLVCSNCGSNLELCYDAPKWISKYEDGEPTGAAMVEQRILVNPCSCYTKQVADMKRAAKLLFSDLIDKEA